MLIAAVLVFALSRAELLERFNAPVVTQSDGLVKVYAMCPEDMRKECRKRVSKSILKVLDRFEREKK